MNYIEALKYLKSVQEKGAKLELENIQKIIDTLPFDLKKINFIQVAGTNGKGSTCHFITAILMAAGYRVGLFTSPHLQDIRERITINKTWISKKEFARYLSEIKVIWESISRQGTNLTTPTFFEHLFLTALYSFYQHQVDFAVLEVGLGGRLDATSTIVPRVSVITNISFDHTKTLGRSLKEIATEKSGIIKPGIPVVSGCQVDSVADKTIKKFALKKKCAYYNVLDEKNILSRDPDPATSNYIYRVGKNCYNFKVNLNGEHQALNAATAIKVTQVLTKQGFKITKPSLKKGIKENLIPGRIEIINNFPGIILDGAHNYNSIKALSDFLFQKKKKDLTLIFGVLRDKNYKDMINLLNPFIKNVIITEPVSKRALAAENLVGYFKTKDHIIIEKDLATAYNSARLMKNEILITGSLYLVGEMRNIILGGH